MRTIAGALLIVAASVCLGAGIVADATISGRPSGSATGYMAAFVLGLFGLVLLLAGLAIDSAGPQGESQPTPRWLWITLLVGFLTVIGLVALMVIWNVHAESRVNVLPLQELMPPNQTLQQTAAAMLVLDSSISLGAAAAAELPR